MICFCGRCGHVFLVLDLVLVVSGAIARHYCFCPTPRKELPR